MPTSSHADTRDRGRAPRHRLAVASRTLAAVAGGYVLASAATALLSVALPVSRASAVLTATMLSFAIFTAAVMTAFAVSSALRAWLWLAPPGAALAAIAWWLSGSAA